MEVCNVNGLNPKSRSGFTIVELLIVIVVIAILAAISVVAYGGIQQRARDSQRAQDMATIKKTLLMYNATHGGVLRTFTYSGAGSGGWNYSAGSNWLSFLETEYGKMPVDPLNVNAFTGREDSSYYYYCYGVGVGGYTVPTVALGYWKEGTSSNVRQEFTVDSCI